MLPEQRDLGYPESNSTSGLLAYVDGEPAVGRCAEPRPAFPFSAEHRTWCKRSQDLTDDRGVWALFRFVTSTPFRYGGVSRTVGQGGRGAHATAARGAVEDTMVMQPGVEITWDEAHVGSRGVFADAGMRQGAAPITRRVVMRIDF
jgi:hypothetical protein